MKHKTVLIDDLLISMKETAYACGKILLDDKLDSLIIQEKTSSRDVVTQYDIAVQKTVVETLGKIFPNAAFFSEECNDNTDIMAELVFVIDPIDGTMNFVKGLRHSCVSIACFCFGEPVVGVVYNPYDNELFSAAKGKAAFLNDMPIHVSDSCLSDTLALFGTSPYNADVLNDTFEKARLVYEKSLDLRRMGSAALDICYVACGRAGLYFEASLSLWDYAAAAVILTEAGGELCDFQGAALRLDGVKSSVIAGNRRTIEESGLLL